MSWDQLWAIYLANDDLQQEQATHKRLDCPRCGKTFTTGPTGERHCTFDGYLPDSDTNPFDTV